MKQLIEALDLALEALEELQPDDAYPYSLQSKAITAIKQARSAPVQEPAIKQGWDVDTLLDKPAAQRQWVGLTDEEMRELEKQFEAERVRTSDEEYLVIYPAAYWQWQRAIEAKLKEKNGWYRQHVTDGSPCWCEPEISYTNPETGASVIVHKEPQ